MHCKPEVIFISASSAHEQSIASTTDFPMDSSFTLFFFFFCVCVLSEEKSLHKITKINPRDGGKQPPVTFQ